MSLDSLSQAVAKLRKKKGFYTPTAVTGFVGGKHRTRNAELMLAKLMLVATEVSEAAEACRDENVEKFSAELANIIICVLDISASCGIDIGAYVRIAFSEWLTRPTMHGRKIRL